MAAKKTENFLDEAIETTKKAFWYVFLFSMAANFLVIPVPIYSLQVLDRVISSGSMETLVMLTIIMVLLLGVFALFQIARSMTLIKIGEWLERKVASRLLSTSIATSATTPGMMGSQNLRDLGTLKGFLTGPGLSAIFDAPWSLVYLFIIFMIHYSLGVICLAGAAVLVFIAMLNEKAVKKALSEANEVSVKSMGHIEVSARNAEVIEAMGMMDSIVKHWNKTNDRVVESQKIASQRATLISSVAKAFRLFLQVGIVGYGAYLVVFNEITVGGTIAASILSSRVLAPFEAAIGAWSNIAGARKAYERLVKAITLSPERKQTISLPRPEGRFSVEKVFYMPPGTNKQVLKGISFQINPGEILGVIGPSAAGKSTLAKLMVGVWRPVAGNVRLDSADVYTWNREEFGRHVGYLPQDVELFDGTVRDNIARMRSDATDEEVIAAAKITGAHDMILRLPNGYETQIGVAGSNLSAGQRQRIGLARAFFGNPKFLVLDEPNSNLDEIGESALVMAVRNAKALKITTVIISHRQSILSFVDKILVLQDGAVADFGIAQEILAKYAKQSIAAAEKAKQIKQQQAASAEQNKPDNIAKINENKTVAEKKE